jgi:hypothetical protein
MMGYDWGEGKSERAVLAESRGLRTATQIAKLFKVSSQTVRSVLSPTEWHHTSKMFNETDYYDPDTVTPEQIDKMQSTEQERRQAKKSGVTTKRCDVEYIVWSGSRKHPQKTTILLENVDVDFVAGNDFVTIHTPDGPLRKKQTGNWIKITPLTEER